MRNEKSEELASKLFPLIRAYPVGASLEVLSRALVALVIIEGRAIKVDPEELLASLLGEALKQVHAAGVAASEKPGVN